MSTATREQRENFAGLVERVTFHNPDNGFCVLRVKARSMRDLITGYGQFWGMRSGSGLVLGSGDRLAVAEADAANDLGEAVGAVQSAPVALG